MNLTKTITLSEDELLEALLQYVNKKHKVGGIKKKLTFLNGNVECDLLFTKVKFEVVD
tara:strand:+ start:294 stop:467 length:174 start_codon:yes stop_codon:yes gene_type:complete